VNGERPARDGNREKEKPMWICPKCGEEVEAHFEVCWSCGTSPEGVEDPDFGLAQAEKEAAAVDEDRPQAIFDDSERLVTVASFHVPHEAHALRMRLEEAGIRVFLADEFTVTMDWLLSNAIGGIKVQVSEHDLERVREILGLPAPEDTDEEDLKSEDFRDEDFEDDSGEDDSEDDEPDDRIWKPDDRVWKPR
jgi:hypothetical protein